MLKRLIWAAAHSSKQLAAAEGGWLVARGGSHAAAPGIKTCTAQQLMALRGAAQQQQPAAAWRHLRDRHLQGARRAYSTAEGTAAATGAKASTSSILEHAAEAQMQKVLKAKGEAIPDASPPTLISRAFGALLDAVMLGAVGSLLFAGYYAYTETEQLDAALAAARASLGEAEPLPPPPALHPLPAAGGAPPPPPPPAPLLPAARSEPPAVSGEPAVGGAVAYPAATRVWCEAMERYLRVRKWVEKSIRDYRDPTYHKLLPDMAPELRGRVKTLVLDLDDLLVHKEWTRQTGWKVYKRPGVQDFLLEMGGYFELVIFTDTTATYAEPIISKLDPQRMIMYRLYRPETQYHNGKHVRDLSKLNRDLSQVLMLSSNPDAWEFQPENTIKLKPWIKDFEDTTLLDLIPMLQLVATKGVQDVRDVVRSYDGEPDVAKAFKARMAQIAAQHKQSKPRSLLGSLGK